MNEKKILADLGFPEPHDVHGRTSITNLFKPDDRCGIYILSFTDGEYYVGLATNVTRRFNEHRKTYPDIAGITFKPVPEFKLREIETKTIGILEEEGFLLRNRADTSIPKGESNFDVIMSITDQERWLKDFDFIDNAGERQEEPELRRKHRGEFEKLMSKPNATDIVQTLRTYVQFGLPAIRRSEIWFWSISCFPGNSTEVYARININWQEVCAVFGNGKPWFTIQIAASSLKQSSWVDKLSLRFRYPLHLHINHKYKTGGPDQIRIELPASYVEDFIREPQILSAIRLFNLRLMKKGPNNPNNIQAHCLDLADKLV